MDIGLQKGNLIYLKDYDWAILILKVVSLLTAPLLALMIMIAPVHAAVEAVAPDGGGYYTLIPNGPSFGQFSTTAAACDYWLVNSCEAYWVTLGRHCYDFQYSPSTEFDGRYCTARVSIDGFSTGIKVRFIDATCPVPPVNPQNNYVYDRTTGKCQRTVPDAVICPIDPLPALPKDDLCTQSLEKGAGKDINNACTLTLDNRWIGNNGHMKCLADKINKLPLMPHYTEPSATIRTTAYQNHLLNVFNKLEEIKKTQLSDEEKQKCASVIADVNVHKLRHGIVSEPSAADDKAPHVLGKAIDIPEAIANALIAKVTTYNTVTLLPNCSFCIPITVIASDVENYVKSASINPPACNVRWGGRFGRVDNVHFQLP